MKTNYLIVVLIIILILIFVLQVMQDSARKSEESKQNQVTLSVVIASSPEKIFLVTEPVVLNFSEPVDTSSVSIKTNPEESVVTSFNLDRTVLSIGPVKTWIYSTPYTITISYLGQDYKVNFMTQEYRGI